MNPETKAIFAEWGSYIGVEGDTVFITLLMTFVGSLMFFLLWLANRSNHKEYEQVDAEVNKKGEIKKYTKGNYAKDVKRFVKLYKSAKTPTEFKELREVCERITDNVDKIEMMGRSSYNGRLWAGLHSAYKACSATLDYLDMGNSSLDLMRNTVYFKVDYYGDKKNDDVLGVSRVIYTEVHHISQVYYANNRLPKALKSSRIRKANARINYDIRLNRYGTRKSVDAIRNIIEGNAA